MLGLIMPGAFGPELSISYGNIGYVFECFAFEPEERLVGLWMVTTYLNKYKAIEIDKLKKRK